MAEIQYSWPERSATKILGGTQSRLDGMAKATGTAKYTYDINLKNMLIARGLGCPHAHCKIVTMDTSAAEKVPGVVHIHVLDHAKPGSEILWQGELLAIVAAELSGISERRTERLVNPALSGLPAFLAHDPGVDSGLMIAQYTQAGLVSELKRLAVPASVDSIPSSAMQEDHVSMGSSAKLGSP